MTVRLRRIDQPGQTVRVDRVALLDPPAFRPVDRKDRPVSRNAAPMQVLAHGAAPLPASILPWSNGAETAFVSQCAFCHGSNAKGGEGGPDLIRSVLVLDDENGNEIGQVILNGRPAKGMPKFSMSQAQIIEIATFLHQRVFDAAQRGSYKILNIVTGDPQKGKQYFDGAGKCATCHSADGDLKGIASKYDPPTLETKFLMPRGRGFFGPPEPEKKPITALITLPSGKSFDGKLEHIDDFNVVLITPDGEYHSFDRNGDSPKIEIHDPLQAHFDMLTKYTDEDIRNLTAYLETLK